MYSAGGGKLHRSFAAKDAAQNDKTPVHEGSSKGLLLWSAAVLQ